MNLRKVKTTFKSFMELLSVLQWRRNHLWYTKTRHYCLSLSHSLSLSYTVSLSSSLAFLCVVTKWCRDNLPLIAEGNNFTRKKIGKKKESFIIGKKHYTIAKFFFIIVFNYYFRKRNLSVSKNVINYLRIVVFRQKQCDFSRWMRTGYFCLFFYIFFWNFLYYFFNQTLIQCHVAADWTTHVPSAKCNANQFAARIGSTLSCMLFCLQIFFFFNKRLLRFCLEFKFNFN